MDKRTIGTAAVLFLLAAPASAVPCPVPAAVCQDQASSKDKDQAKSRYKWWVNDKSRAELGITDEQSAAIEQVWQASLPKLRASHRQVDDLEKVLSEMIREAANEQDVIAQIDRVESTRSDLNKARTLMLYRMNRLLTSDQRQKLKAMHDHRDESRRRSSQR